MDETRTPRRWSWPLAFFILNLAAIAGWFLLHGTSSQRGLTLTGFSPDGRDLDPAAVSEILLNYSLPLDPDSVKPDALRFIPPLSGKTEPAGNAALRFVPAEPLRPATLYTIVPSADIRGKNGEAPRQEPLEFATARLRFLSAAQAGYDRSSFTVELAFNQPVAPEELKRSLDVRFSVPEPREGNDERVTVLGTAPSRLLRLRIREPRSCHLRLTLPAGMAGIGGPLGLADDQTLLFRLFSGPKDDPTARPDWAGDAVAIDLKPEVAFLGMTAEWDDGSGVVLVRTTAPLDPARAGGFVRVDPAVPVTFASAWNGLRILGAFEPGKQYRVTLAEGLPATGAGELPAAIARTVWFDDLPASFAFTHGGGFLAPEGLLKVPVKTRNLDAFRLEMRRLYASNIVEVLLKEYGDSVDADYSEPEVSRRFVTRGARNREAETLLDLRELAGGSPLGVYGLEIHPEDRPWHRREAVIAVSDLGLGVRQGRERLLAWTTSLREGTSRGDVMVGVYSNKRQLLAEGVTDADGTILLDLPPLPADERPVLVLAEGEHGEFSFVRLDRDNRSRGAESRSGPAYPLNYEVFLTAERGVYRGGETVLVTGLAREADRSPAPELPLELRLLGPDGKQVKTDAVPSDALGRLSHALPLGESAPGGLYTLEARLPGQKEVLGVARFRIADYIPETLSITMELEEGKGEDGDDDGRDGRNRLLIRVARLAGGELGPLPVEVAASYAPEPFRPKGWEDWTFGDARLAGRTAERRERSTRLDGTGAARTEWDDPELAFPAAALMTVRVEASETGGRAAAELLRRTVHQSRFYTGVRPPAGQPAAGEPADFRLAAVLPDGRVDDGVNGPWTGNLMRVEYTGVMKRTDNGRLAYQWVRQEIPEERLSGNWELGLSRVDLTPRAGGQYRLALDAAGGKGCVFDFSVSGPGAAWHGENPETLTLTLDKKAYAVGEEAVVTTASPFAGRALITVETGEVLDHRFEDFREGENSFRVQVGEAMRPNAHVGVTLVRPARAEAEWRPHRLSGSAVLPVDNADRRLLVEFDAPEAVTPGKTAAVTVKVTRDGQPAAEAPVVLWAVDMGVLSLTDYATPSPWDVFYALRRPGVTEADMFSRLAPELTAWLAADPSPGGDAAAVARRLNPIFANRVKAAVIHNASLVTDADGNARAELPIPEFAGRLRLMCWTADGDAMGSLDLELEVKAPVSLNAAWPRFAAPGDVFQVPVTVVNRSGTTGRVTVDVVSPKGLDLEPASREIELAENGSGIVTFTATCGDPGVARAAFTARLGEESFTDRVEFAIRPPLLFARESGVVTLEPGEERTLVLGAGMMEKNSRVKLLAGGHPLVGLSGCLDALLDYPYGCAEQTASRLLALTYLPDLVALSRPGQLESGEIAVLTTACIERLSSMQNANGAVSMWPRGGGELFWVSAQALFSLVESRSAGHPIPDALVDRLAQYLDSRLDKEFADSMLDADGGEAAAMACLALARSGKLKRSWLLRLEEIADDRARAGKPLSSVALAFLSEAVGVAGDSDAGLALYHRFKPGGVDSGRQRNRVMELGAWLLAAMALGADADEQDAYAARLGEMIKDSFTQWTTKENSLILTALGRYWQKVGPLPDATAFLRRNGAETGFSTRRGAVWNDLPAGARVEVKNSAEGSLRLFWLAEGIPLSGKAREEDVGMTARRRLYDRNGHEVPGPFELNRGEVYEVRLEVTGKADDLVLVDLLPAGLEIEDATLKGRSGDGGGGGLSVKNVERRDDRLLVFASVDGSGEYRYLARAVTGGRFAWPALDASRMYDAGERSVHGAAAMTVTDKAANDR